MYLPFRADISDKLSDKNELIIYFYQHNKMLDFYDKTMNEEWRGNVPAGSMLNRMHDYGHNPQKKHGYKPIGLFDKVFLETVEHAELSDFDLDVIFPRTTLDLALVKVKLDGKSYDDVPLSAKLSICEFDGSHAQSVKMDIAPEGGIWEAGAEISVENPKLWWPKNYG
jgi:beta-galactosidase/beta-glucuronidase